MPETAWRIYHAIGVHILEQGYPPSRQEIADQVGCHLGTAKHWCGQLREWGYLTWTPHVTRSIVLLRPIP